MTWRYHVARDEFGQYGIVEVYTEPFGFTERFVTPVGDNLDELRWTLERMLEAALDSDPERILDLTDYGPHVAGGMEEK